MADRAFKIVPKEPSTEHLLREAIRGRAEAVKVVADFDRIIAEQGRVLARKRGVSFIRVEHLRSEFGR